MKDFGLALQAGMKLLQTKLTFEELTFSFWDILLWLIVAGAVVFVVVKWIGD